MASYNRYLAVASRAVRRSLKEEKRLHAERRGEMDLRFAKWEVSFNVWKQLNRNRS
jgi:F-type H+-transporting ATPase subunit epsilon